MYYRAWKEFNNDLMIYILYHVTKLESLKIIENNISATGVFLRVNNIPLKRGSAYSKENYTDNRIDFVINKKKLIITYINPKDI